MMKYNIAALFVAVMCLTSCTLSLNTVCSVGKSEDVIDEDLKNEPNVTPNFDLNFPAQL